MLVWAREFIVHRYGCNSLHLCFCIVSWRI